MSYSAEYVVQQLKPVVHDWLIQKSVTETIKDACGKVKQRLLSVFQCLYDEPLTVDNYWSIISDKDANTYHNAYDEWVERSMFYVERRGYCPFLVAEYRLCGIENEMIRTGLTAMGHDESLSGLLYGEQRKEFIHLCTSMVINHPSFVSPTEEELHERGEEYTKKGHAACQKQ